MRYRYQVLSDFVTALGRAAGLAPERAAAQAEILLDADLMGHTTHGLNLLPGFLGELEAGTLATAGDPSVVSDHGSAIVWDGNFLPGTWLVTHALEQMEARIDTHPLVSLVLKRSGHIGALAPYLQRATDHGLMMLLACTNPAARTVAPAGGIDPLLAPNPVGFGYPTDGDPVLVDISTSTVANGWIRRWSDESTPLAGEWVQDAQGVPTTDPRAFLDSPPGTLLPLGGVALGHKGFGLGLIVEALTGGLSGVGHDPEAGAIGNLAYLQLIDPAAFAGSDESRRDLGRLSAACRASRPRPGGEAVRLPGDAALARRRAQLAGGVELYPTILPRLERWASKFDVPLPEPIG